MVRAHLELAHAAKPLDIWCRAGSGKPPNSRGKPLLRLPAPTTWIFPVRRRRTFDSARPLPSVGANAGAQAPEKNGGEKKKKGSKKELQNPFLVRTCSPKYFTRRLCLGCCVCVAALVSPSSVLCVAESVLLRCADAAGAGLSQQRFCTGIFIFLVLPKCRQL